MESIWSDLQRRSSGETIKKEDIGKIIEIDGVKYTLSKEFWALGDEYEEENSDKWRCFAFNKPKSGTLVEGNGEDTGVFGEDKWDIGEDSGPGHTYDVYVLRDYIDKDRDDYIDELIKNGTFEQVDSEFAEIQDILVNYTKKIFEDNHMSEFAHYTIYEMLGENWDFYGAIRFVDAKYIHCGKKPYRLPCDTEVKYDKLEDYHIILYPLIDNWADKLELEIITIYNNLGWTQIEEFSVDPFDSPCETGALCFAKLNNIQSKGGWKD